MSTFLNKGDAIINAINRVLMFFGIIAMSFIVFNIVGAVLMNKLFDKSFPIPADVSGYLMMIAACCGYAGYQYSGGFIRVTMLTDTFKGTLAKVVEVFCYVVVICFYFLLAYRSYVSGCSAISSHEMMMSVDVEVWPFWFCLAVGILWTALVTIFQMVRYIATDK